MSGRNKLACLSLQLRLMSAEKGAYPRVEHQVGSGLTGKHYTRLERLAIDKNTSLLRTFINYGRKKLYTL